MFNPAAPRPPPPPPRPKSVHLQASGVSRDSSEHGRATRELYSTPSYSYSSYLYNNGAVNQQHAIAPQALSQYQQHTHMSAVYVNQQQYGHQQFQHQTLTVPSIRPYQHNNHCINYTNRIGYQILAPLDGCQNRNAASSATLPPCDGRARQPDFSCEPCGKSFTNQNALDSHTATHDKCSACSFHGTKKVVALHYQMTHGSFSGNGYKEIEVEGQRFKVLMGTDPEEVTEWRSQRRAKFPTREAREKKENRDSLRQIEGGIEKETATTKLPSKKRAHGPDSGRKVFLEGKKRKTCASNNTDANDIKHHGDLNEAPKDPTVYDMSIQYCQRDGDVDKSDLEFSCTSTISSKVKSSLMPPARKKIGGVNSCRKSKREQENSNGMIQLESSLYSKLVQSEFEREDNILLQCLHHIVNNAYAT